MIGDFIDLSAAPEPAMPADALPWAMTSCAEAFLGIVLQSVAPDDFLIRDSIAIHRTARIDSTAVIKAPSVIGPGCFVGAQTLLRSGVWLHAECSIGPGCEVKSSFLFRGARLAHFNYIGDSIVGADVNFEAGSIVANRRNERTGSVLVRMGDTLIDTGCEKFGALVGDSARIGANAVLAPGTILRSQAIVHRLELVDQEKSDHQRHSG